MIFSVTFAGQTVKFIVVGFVMLAAFTLSYYFACIKLRDLDHYDQEIDETLIDQDEEFTHRRVNVNFGLLL
jgi:hypothetical protein